MTGVLVDRDEERVRIDGLLDDARAGKSGALLLRGEAGIGKSALLDYASDAAHEMRILRASGVESESELPFAVLAQLLRPILDKLPLIPKPQRAALDVALALARGTADRFATSAGTLSLLALAAEERPLLAIVDDAHWLDGSSRDVLVFVARRLEAEHVAILFAARSPGELFDVRSVPELVVGGLDRRAASELLARYGTGGLTPEVIEQLRLATGGNPLALFETCGLLTVEQQRGDDALPDPLPAGPSVEQAFIKRLSVLPQPTRTVLLVAAASETGAMLEVAVAVRRLGTDLAALEVAEAADVVSIEEGIIRFRHPLLRSAVYQSAGLSERRAVHRALAAALADGAPMRRAWHLARAATAPDEDTASALEVAAVDARGRGGHAAAASAFHRAAVLTPDPGRRANRLLEAARDSHLAGRLDAAIHQLDEGLDLTRDPLLRADIHHLRGRIQMFRGGPMDVHQVLVGEAAQVEGRDPERAAYMLAEAALPCFMAARSVAALETSRRAFDVAERVGGAAELAASACLGSALVLRGRASEGVPLLVDLHRALMKADALAMLPVMQMGAAGLLWSDELDLGSALMHRGIAAARRVSAAGVLPFLLGTLSELDFRSGRWMDGTAHAAEAVRLSIDTDQDSLLGYTLSCIARFEAAKGMEQACRDHVRQAMQRADLAGIESIRDHALAILGLLCLSTGNLAEAREHLEGVEELADQQGVLDPGVVEWAGDLVETHVRAGERERARIVLERFSAEAQATGRLSALARTARGRGLLADDDEFDEPFTESLRWHAKVEMPFQTARTELVYGERLRRVRRLAEARDMLRRALVTFDRLGAAPWSERTRTELRATGERVRRHAATSDRLTSQELQVALAVARGATNREVATALFLSPKTVEFHLGHVYRKLGVRSRTELTRHLLSAGAVKAEA